MGLFEGSAANAAYDRFFESNSEDHDPCECEDCHGAGSHAVVLDWYRKCPHCEIIAMDQVRFTEIHPTFNMTDLARAESWAKENGYNYASVPELMADAYLSQIIKPSKRQILSVHC